MVAPARSTGRAPRRSTSMPAGIRATAEPRPTAANTAPNPAGPRPNLFWMSTPMAGRPNCTTDTAAWAMTAMISVVRGRGLIATRYPGLGECMLAPVSAIERTRCPICAKGHPLDVIAELDTTWVSAPPVAVLPGYACVVARRHVEEPFQLPDDQMVALWRESMRVARALSSLREPGKMNSAITGRSRWTRPPTPAPRMTSGAWPMPSPRCAAAAPRSTDPCPREEVPCLAMVRLDRIYTRAGDAGETSLGDGERVSKSSARIWAYGTVDETGAAIGVAIATGLEPASVDLLRRVQNDLFDLGADLAVPVDTERGHGKSRLRITEQHVAALEAACDDQGERLAPVTSFVLSGGTSQSAALHLARTVCRGAERYVVALSAETTVNPHALSYLNRLSDLLFILARVHNDEGRGDVLWQPGSSLA